MAAELILNANASRSDWLKVRYLGIGGSDAGAIMGLNPYKSAITLWAEKTGKQEPADLENNTIVQMGNVLEPYVARLFSESTGKKVRRRGTLRDTDHPWMLANVDRWIPGEGVGLEIKTASTRLKKAWSPEDVPDSYYAQCLHYMSVTGAPYWYIAVLFRDDGVFPEPVKIPRIETDIQDLRMKEKIFWDHVESGTMPEEIDGSESTARTLSALYHNGTADTLELPGEAWELVQKYDELQKEKKDIEASTQEIKNQLMAMMKDAEVATIEDRKITWKTGKPRETVSLAKIKKQDPASYEALHAAGLISVSEPSRTFRIW